MAEASPYNGSSHMWVTESAFVFTMIWLFPLICSAGIFLNFSSLAVVLKFRNMYSPSAGIFIAFICASNGGTLIVKGLIHYFESLSRFNLTWWLYERESISRTSAAACAIYIGVTYLALVGTPYYQLGLTLDRVVSVLRPIKNRHGLSHGFVWITISTLTVVAASIAIFSAVAVQFDSGQCTHPNPTTATFEAFRLYEFIMGRVVLFTCMLMGTVIIVVALRGPQFTRRQLPPQRPANKLTTRSKRPHRKTTLILVLLNVSYMLCSLPAGLYVAVRTADPDLERRMGERTHNMVHMLLNTLMYFDFCLNGGTLLVSRRFRNAFVATVGCGRSSCCRHGGGKNRVSGTLRSDKIANNVDLNNEDVRRTT